MNKTMMAMGAAVFSVVAMASIDVVKERQEGFESFKTELGAIKKIVQSGDVSKQSDLKGHVQNLLSAVDKQWQRKDHLFPAGSHTGETDALPSIWEKPAEFNEAIDRQAEALALMQNAAQTSDPGQWKMAFGKVGNSCKGCHDSFKKE